MNQKIKYCSVIIFATILLVSCKKDDTEIVNQDDLSVSVFSENIIRTLKHDNEFYCLSLNSGKINLIKIDNSSNFTKLAEVALKIETKPPLKIDSISFSISPYDNGIIISNVQKNVLQFMKYSNTGTFQYSFEYKLEDFPDAYYTKFVDVIERSSNEILIFTQALTPDNLYLIITTLDNKGHILNEKNIIIEGFSIQGVIELNGLYNVVSVFEFDIGSREKLRVFFRTIDKDGNIINNSIINEIPGIDELTNMYFDTEGYIIVAGYGDMQSVFFKVQINGKIEWLKEYRFDEFTLIYDIIKISDGYVITGAKMNNGNQQKLFWQKIDKVGNLIWESGIESKFLSLGLGIMKTTNGYSIVGSRESFGFYRNVIFIKIDEEGNQI